MIPENFDHPCRQTCSGWQQGYDRGASDKEKLIDLLRRGLDFAGHAEDVPAKEVDAKQWAIEVRDLIRK